MNNVKMAIVVIALFVSPKSWAEERTMEEQVHRTCSAFSLLGEAIAKARYRGIPLRTIKGKMSGQNAMVQSIVTDAYNLPDWSGEERQQRAITEFGNKAYQTCTKEVRER